MRNQTIRYGKARLARFDSVRVFGYTGRGHIRSAIRKINKEN